MSDTIQTAITALEQELEATQQRCTLIERSIAGLREIYGVAERSNGRPKSANKTDGRSKARANGKRGAALTPRSLPDKANHTAQIVAAVRNAGGVMKRGELKDALGASLYHTINWLKIAIKERAVVATGTKATYRISLPGKSPAKEHL